MTISSWEGYRITITEPGTEQVVDYADMIGHILRDSTGHYHNSVDDWMKNRVAMLIKKGQYV